jgi:hypothetical protein
MYPSVNCVVHSHADEVLPYVTTKVPLQPVFHMAGFLGKSLASNFYFSRSAGLTQTYREIRPSI